ncbi:hypothetical protein [Archangium sp.]|uniref:hypothetical protein n=1 Tax=Archangium sp. TaxID=1872627 RepID=UPI00286C3420|nr:hypothetical protein [Archangium sp.]
MSIQREWKFGTHEARFEEPDTLWVKIQGDTSLKDATALSELYGEVGGRGPFYVVTDLREATTVDAEAREHVSKNINPGWFLGSIYIGAGFLHRAVAKSLSLMHYLTGRLTFELHFVSTEEEARVLLARERNKRSAQVA